MKRSLGGLLAVAMWISLAGVSDPRAAGRQTPAPAASPSTLAASHRAVINQYCVTCHNERLKTGGLTLDSQDLAKVPENAEVWEKVVRKLAGGAMPPPGVRRPDQATIDGLRQWLETELDGGAVAKVNPGRPVLHRLNRSEYSNATRDLLALDIEDVASLLPADDAGYGFDNIADVLGISPSLLERYLVAAGKISSLAVGDVSVKPGGETYRVRQDLSQDQHIEGLPLGTVGGLTVHHSFPLDGEYLFKVKLYRTNLGSMRGLEHQHELEITIDGERVQLAKFGGDEDLKALQKNETLGSDAVDARLQVRVPVKAGPRDVTVAFLERSHGVETMRLQPLVRSSADTLASAGRPHIDTLAITGPFNPTGPGDTPTRQRIFTCHPANRAAEDACATKIITTLARRAYRESVGADDIRPLLTFYETGRKKGGFEAGVQMALRRILASPRFVFRVERDADTLAPGSVHRISDTELASRLSFFLWSSIPDEELLRVAAQGRLRTPAVLAQQVKRMLEDPKAETLVTNFAGQWLQLRNLRQVAPNSDDFPDFDDNLRKGFQRETELLFGSIMHEDRSVLELLSADYTFVNERLAKHYGIPNIYGSHFRRVTITDDTRKGLLGQGSILTVTSHSDRTSPVLRGKWILENLLSMPPPPPPPDVPPFPENAEEQKPRSVRERLEQHRANPACASCHKTMDPLGFALENFDATGAWRNREAGAAIDASGELVDGTKINGVATLRQALLKKPEAFVGTMTEKLMTYALGRGVAYYDMPAVRQIVRESARTNYPFSSLIMGVIKSVPFQMRMKPMPGTQVARADVSQ